MALGTISYFDDLGFGALTADDEDGRELKFSYKGVRKSEYTPGVKVSYDETEDGKATNVTPLS